MPRMYEWIDPWDAIDSFDHAWRKREDEHHAQLTATARACADASFQLGQQMQKLMQAMTTTPFATIPPMVIRK